MSALKEKAVLAKTRAASLEGVKTLNCWGSNLQDVSGLCFLPLSLSLPFALIVHRLAHITLSHTGVAAEAYAQLGGRQLEVKPF